MKSFVILVKMSHKKMFHNIEHQFQIDSLLDFLLKYASYLYDDQKLKYLSFAK